MDDVTKEYLSKQFANIDGQFNQLKTVMQQRFDAVDKIMQQRFDAVDTDLHVLLDHADSQYAELKERVDDHGRRIEKLKSPPAVAHTVKK